VSGLVLTLKERPRQRLDLSPLLPERLQGLDAAAVDALELAGGNRRTRVGDLFAVTPGDPSDLRIAGACDRLDNIGHGMTSGTITVAISSDVSAAARAFDYTIVSGASRLSGRIVSCRRSPVNVAHPLDVTTPNRRGETLVNIVGLPFAAGTVPDDPVAAIAVERFYEYPDAVSGIVTLSIEAD